MCVCERKRTPGSFFYILLMYIAYKINLSTNTNFSSCFYLIEWQNERVIPHLDQFRTGVHFKRLFCTVPQLPRVIVLCARFVNINKDLNKMYLLIFYSTIQIIP